jgi:hypothetical protein
MRRQVPHLLSQKGSPLSKYMNTENGPLVLQDDTPFNHLCEASGYLRLSVRATDGTLGKMQRKTHAAQ